MPGALGAEDGSAGAAEEALRKGLATFPKDGAFGAGAGPAALQDKDSEGALAALQQGAPQVDGGRGGEAS